MPESEIDNKIEIDIENKSENKTEIENKDELKEEEELKEEDKKELINFLSRFSKLSTVFVLIILFVLIYIVTAPFSTFDSPKMIQINTGDSLKTISSEFKEEGIIKSSSLLRFSISVLGGQNKIKAGVYKFEKPSNVWNVAYRLVNENYGYLPIKITFPEGINSSGILKNIEAKIPDIKNSASYELDKQNLISKEGFLFPDTYFFPPNATLKIITDRMSDEYERKIKKYRADIEKSGHTEKEIITMASILEEEVKSKEDKKMAADLLWRRIEKGMLLQVDSTIGYLNGKVSHELTKEDLSTNSPYNTYKFKGLPPTPISNPGIDAIEAALFPTKNEYLFFLTDSLGKTYFSKTYEEHLRFKRLYIR